MSLFVGIDWAARSHELCVVDEAGAIAFRFGFAHSERGISAAFARLAELAPANELPVAIERPSGLLVERLLEAGHPVVPVHPNAFAAARGRWGAAGAKSDPGDSYKLADYLRTDGHRLRRLEPMDPVTRHLQALVRLRDDHIAAKTPARTRPNWRILPLTPLPWRPNPRPAAAAPRRRTPPTSRTDPAVLAQLVG